MQVAELAPIPKIVHPSQHAGIVRSIEWCPWPLKCITTKETCRTRKMTGGYACMCANCVLFRTGAA